MGEIGPSYALSDYFSSRPPASAGFPGAGKDDFKSMGFELDDTIAGTNRHRLAFEESCHVLLRLPHGKCRKLNISNKWPLHEPNRDEPWGSLVTRNHKLLDVLQTTIETGRRHDHRCGSHDHGGRYWIAESTTADTRFRHCPLIGGTSAQKQGLSCFVAEGNLEPKTESRLQEL